MTIKSDLILLLGTLESFSGTICSLWFSIIFQKVQFLYMLTEKLTVHTMFFLVLLKIGNNP